MPMMQAYNPQNKRYVKYHFVKKDGKSQFKVSGMQKKPFKGVPFKNKKKQ